MLETQILGVSLFSNMMCKTFDNEQSKMTTMLIKQKTTIGTLLKESISLKIENGCSASLRLSNACNFLFLFVSQSCFDDIFVLQNISINLSSFFMAHNIFITQKIYPLSSNWLHFLFLTYVLNELPMLIC